MDPDYALVHRHVASILLLRERPAGAAHHLRRSLEIDPRQPDAEQMRYKLARLEHTLESDRAAEPGSAGARATP